MPSIRLTRKRTAMEAEAEAAEAEMEPKIEDAAEAEAKAAALQESGANMRPIKRMKSSHTVEPVVQRTNRRGRNEVKNTPAIAAEPVANGRVLRQRTNGRVSTAPSTQNSAPSSRAASTIHTSAMPPPDSQQSTSSKSAGKNKADRQSQASSLASENAKNELTLRKGVPTPTNLHPYQDLTADQHDACSMFLTCSLIPPGTTQESKDTATRNHRARHTIAKNWGKPLEYIINYNFAPPDQPTTYAKHFLSQMSSMSISIPDSVKAMDLLVETYEGRADRGRTGLRVQDVRMAIEGMKARPDFVEEAGRANRRNRGGGSAPIAAANGRKDRPATRGGRATSAASGTSASTGTDTESKRGASSSRGGKGGKNTRGGGKAKGGGSKPKKKKEKGPGSDEKEHHEEEVHEEDESSALSQLETDSEATDSTGAARSTRSVEVKKQKSKGRSTKRGQQAEEKASPPPPPPPPPAPLSTISLNQKASSLKRKRGKEAENIGIENQAVSSTAQSKSGNNNGTTTNTATAATAKTTATTGSSRRVRHKPDAELVSLPPIPPRSRPSAKSTAASSSRQRPYRPPGPELYLGKDYALLSDSDSEDDEDGFGAEMDKLKQERRARHKQFKERAARLSPSPDTRRIMEGYYAWQSTRPAKYGGPIPSSADKEKGKENEGEQGKEKAVESGLRGGEASVAALVGNAKGKEKEGAQVPARPAAQVQVQATPARAEPVAEAVQENVNIKEEVEDEVTFEEAMRNIQMVAQGRAAVPPGPVLPAREAVRESSRNEMAGNYQHSQEVMKERPHIEQAQVRGLESEHEDVGHQNPGIATHQEIEPPRLIKQEGDIVEGNVTWNELGEYAIEAARGIVDAQVEWDELIWETEAAAAIQAAGALVEAPAVNAGPISNHTTTRSAFTRTETTNSPTSPGMQDIQEDGIDMDMSEDDGGEIAGLDTDVDMNEDTELDEEDQWMLQDLDNLIAEREGWQRNARNWIFPPFGDANMEDSADNQEGRSIKEESPPANNELPLESSPELPPIKAESTPVTWPPEAELQVEAQGGGREGRQVVEQGQQRERDRGRVSQREPVVWNSWEFLSADHMMDPGSEADVHGWFVEERREKRAAEAARVAEQQRVAEEERTAAREKRMEQMRAEALAQLTAASRETEKILRKLIAKKRTIAAVKADIAALEAARPKILSEAKEAVDREIQQILAQRQAKAQMQNSSAQEMDLPQKMELDG